uniref:DUF1758 domain-containing protein n=1 Tax=Strongyloides papillosus TaxID=174720 RepID=A0A0N5C5F9_STREA
MSSDSGKTVNFSYNSLLDGKDKSLDGSNSFSLKDGEQKVLSSKLSGIQPRPAVDDKICKYVNVLRSKDWTLEGILGLMELGEAVGTLSKKTLWSAEADIHVLRTFTKIEPIYQVRQAYRTQDRTYLPKSISFPTGVSVPALHQMKIEYVSGDVSGRLPESLRTLWLCGANDFDNKGISLVGLNQLRVLVTSDCKCGQLVKSFAGMTMKGQVVIIPDARYDGWVLNLTESFRRAMLMKRRGIVYHSGPTSFKKFATPHVFIQNVIIKDRIDCNNVILMKGLFYIFTSYYHPRIAPR